MCDQRWCGKIHAGTERRADGSLFTQDVLDHPVGPTRETPTVVRDRPRRHRPPRPSEQLTPLNEGPLRIPVLGEPRLEFDPDLVLGGIAHLVNVPRCDLQIGAERRDALALRDGRVRDHDRHV